MCAPFILTKAGWRRWKAPRARLNQTNEHASRQRFRGEKIGLFRGIRECWLCFLGVILGSRWTFKETTDPCAGGCVGMVTHNVN